MSGFDYSMRQRTPFCFGKKGWVLLFVGQALLLLSLIYKAKGMILILGSLLGFIVFIYNPLLSLFVFVFLSPAFHWMDVIIGHRIIFLLPLFVEVSWLLRWLITESPRSSVMKGIQRWMLITSLVLLSAMSASLMANIPEGGIKAILNNEYSYVQLFAVPLLMPLLVNTISKLKTLLLVIILSAVFSLVPDVKTLMARQIGRVLGFSMDANFFAMFLVMVLPILYGYLASSTSRVVKVVGSVAFLTLFIAFIGTVSRGGLLAFAVVFLFLVWRSKYRKYLVATAIVFLMASLVLIPREQWVRFNDVERLGSVVSRYDVQRAGWVAFKEHSLFGVGPGQFEEQFYQYARFTKTIVSRELKWSLHNNYLDVMATTGVFGFAAYVFLIGCVVVYSERARRYFCSYKDMSMAEITTGFQAGFLGFLVASTFLTSFSFSTFWIFWGLCGIVYRLSSIGDPSLNIAT